MKVAFRTHDLGVRGLQPAIQKCKSSGISAVQLVAYKFLDEIKYLPNFLSDENSRAVGAAFKAACIDVPLVGAYFNPVHSNAQKVADCKQIFKDYLRYCKNLGSDTVGSETGSFNDDKWTYNPLNRTPEALTTVIDTFSELADYAKSAGAFVGMEGAAGHVCYNPATLKKAVDAIGADNVRIIFDIYNYLDADNYKDYLEIFDEGLRLFDGNILLFHIKDCVFEDGKLRQVPPGKGMFDFGKLLKKIKAYDKNAVLVLEGTTGEHIEPCTKFILNKWDNL